MIVDEIVGSEEHGCNFIATLVTNYYWLIPRHGILLNLSNRFLNLVTEFDSLK